MEKQLFDDILGKMLSKEEAAQTLKASADYISVLDKQGSLFHVTGSDGKPLYPEFQFKDHAIFEPIQHTAEILKPIAVNEWTIPLWLSGVNMFTQHMRIKDFLHAGGNPEVVYEIAASYVLLTGLNQT